MSTPAQVKTWQKTRVQSLVRHKSGGYYARLFLNGKEVWKSLKTKHFSVAEARLAEVQKDHRQRKTAASSTSSVKMTFTQAAQIHLQRVDAKVNIKRRTKDYWHEIYGGIQRSWPELDEIQIRSLSKPACHEWAARFAKTASSTRFNNSIDFMRHVIAIAVESGVIFTNAADSLTRKPIKQKLLELPTLAQFSALIAEMSKPKGRYSLAASEFAQGLAFTGCRLSEARRIVWKDLDFKASEITVKGDPEEGTKNGEIRRIPMIPNARALFESMRSKRRDEDIGMAVFQVGKCQESMDSAMVKLGISRMTHHDLRHFFATVCIESGVDIPTVSRWLGHKDGGALALKVYGHLRREHSTAQAQKVSFAA